MRGIIRGISASPCQSCFLLFFLHLSLFFFYGLLFQGIGLYRMLLPEVLPNQFEKSAEVEAADIFMWFLTRLRRDRGAVGTVEQHEGLVK